MNPGREPTFAQRAATLVDSALKDDSVVVAMANSTGELLLQCQPKSAAALASIARAVLQQAADQCDRERGAEARTLAGAIARAIAILPDPTADDDGDE